MPTRSECSWLARDHLQSLFDILLNEGFQIVGPTVQGAAIVYDQLHHVSQLPQGWTHRQDAAVYRLEQRSNQRYFGFTVGPHSWKQFLFPPQVTVAVAEKDDAGNWECSPGSSPLAKYAFVGVRACELAAIAVQDRVFIHPQYADPIYAARRSNVFIVAVNCTQADTTCFCCSMNTGPRCTQGYDLALTELEAGFLVECGSERGASILSRLETRCASTQELNAGEQARHQAEIQQRSMETTHLREDLMKRLDHPHWKKIAEQCLSCANCTQVCPTCFCSSVQDIDDLDVTHVERQRVWDSCFNPEFSAMGGGVIRNTTQSRYRQWLTHKLATWQDQYGTSGCVGCGRCITWCPVGIDLTAEIAMLRRDAT